jgi:hypothetical protein
VTRFVLFTASSGEGVGALLEPYAPSVFYRSVDAGTSFNGIGDAHRWSVMPGGDLANAVLALAGDHAGHTVAIAAPAEAIRTLLCHALGVPASAAERFLVTDDTVSVLELDPEQRWAVVRLNEGRSLPGER